MDSNDEVIGVPDETHSPAAVCVLNPLVENVPGRIWQEIAVRKGVVAIKGGKMMEDNAEERVSKFYDTVGWTVEEGITEDARRWEDLREHAKAYVSKCRLRVLNHIPGKGENMLDMGSGPIQYEEYIEYSRNFRKRYCVDLSAKDLETAKQKIGDHGIFSHGSFFDIQIGEDFFDCTISLHTIYHIDKDRQEDAVRKLVRVTRPGKPVIIVYSNPNTIISSLT